MNLALYCQNPPIAADRETTTESPESALDASELADPIATVLVIAWCREAPGRVGELAVIPSEGSVVLGRGAPDNEPRMRFFRPRPGRLEPVPPLSSRGLSRRQLELASRGGEVEVRRVGRCAMRINGRECEAAALSPGDVLSLRQELVLFCVRRPVCPAPLRHFAPAPGARFGAADQHGILGESPAIWRLRDDLAFAAGSGQHLLFVGETGTGKELAARAVHRMSSRAERPLVARNAATLPGSLIDAEVFGNAKNYPNPGMAERAGLVGQADGGFLFLDEIGELPLELQAHLLRVLDSGGEYQRLGEPLPRRSDFRLLAATNRDPSELRHDLLARLTLTVELPPLSERREDIPLLMRHLVVRASEGSPELVRRFTRAGAEGETHVLFDPKLVEALLRHDYTGNTRELDALLWKALGASPDDTVRLTDGLVGSRAPTDRAGGAAPRVFNPEPNEPELRAALREANGSVARAAKTLGFSSRYALYRILQKLGISPDEYR